MYQLSMMEDCIAQHIQIRRWFGQGFPLDTHLKNYEATYFELYLDHVSDSQETFSNGVWVLQDSMP